MNRRAGQRLRNRKRDQEAGRAGQDLFWAHHRRAPRHSLGQNRQSWTSLALGMDEE